MYQELCCFNEEVKEARREGKPIVVLESTIISHGMPYPANKETALAVEDLVRQHGAVPATIALHQGMIHIGLNETLLELLAEQKDIIKASRRDLAFVLSQKKTASTTVAATMYCAHQAGLKIFATGGIGGVHPQVTESFDISADLIELANTPVTVVCAGAKSILDLPKTLEFLETFGVPVVGFGTEEFPAFYSHSSGIALNHTLNTAEEIACLIDYQRRLNLQNGIIIANPIPKEAEIPDAKLQPIIQQARAEAQHIHGKAITPFLLKRIAELTAGDSVKANIELIKNNAILASQIAKSYQKRIDFKQKTNN